MRRFLRISILIALGSCTTGVVPPAPLPTPSEACDAGDQAFVRRATVGVLGRRPNSQGEVDAYVDALAALRREGKDTASARRELVLALSRQSSYRTRWSDFFKDTLRVARTQTKSSAHCYGSTDGAVVDDGALARYVRDHDANEADPPVRGFTMRELLASALELDDLSVLYRANLFAMLGKPLQGNSDPVELERARRDDFGATFEGVYTRRDVGCLRCHNSEYSVTSSSDPTTNRFWPLAGHFERALFDAPTGVETARARGMLRYAGVGGAGAAPYGWSANACGSFLEPRTDDPLGTDTIFGAIRGTRASIWALERSLHRGVDARGDAAELDPDRAFAALVATSIVDRVWTELVGSPLTVSHSFPRTEAQRDVLQRLVDDFVASHFSLRGLVASIVTHPLYNLAAPSAGCGASPYPLPRVFDPWTDMEADVAARGNGPSDRLHPSSPRLLRRALEAALEWPAYVEYPAAASEEETLALGLGFYMRDGEPGRRALGVLGRLTWEAAFGQCPKPTGDDFISRLVTRVRSNPDARVRDAVATLQDRLIGRASMEPEEEPLVEALIGTRLDDAVSDALDGQLRRLCGVLVASPWFLMEGVVADDARGAPRATRPEHDYAPACRWLAEELGRMGIAATLACRPDGDDAR
jgi:hypothetical protein